MHSTQEKLGLSREKSVESLGRKEYFVYKWLIAFAKMFQAGCKKPVKRESASASAFHTVLITLYIGLSRTIVKQTFNKHGVAKKSEVGIYRTRKSL
jgi:hypothetical protein